MIPLAAFEEIIDASGAAARIEAMLPAGVRPRQLTVRTLLAGMCLAQADHRPAHLTRVHQALTSLPEDDQRRLGVIADWKHGPHQLTYRQTEYTFGLAADALAKDEPDGLPSGPLQASATTCWRHRSRRSSKTPAASLAVDWTDLESFSRPPPARGGDCADPEASWGHRKNNLLRREDELFYGYYLSAGIMMPERERARRPRVRPPRHAVVVPARPGPRVRARADRDARQPASRSATCSPTPATPTATRTPGRSRCAPAGAQLVQDLHPHDRGPKGTHHGAIISNGNLYCPATPRPLLELGPLARDATSGTSRRARRPAPPSWPATSSAASPATTRTATTASPAPPPWARSAARSAPAVDDPGPGPARDPPAPRSTRQACCTQQTITVPPEVHAKTAQKHDYPSERTAGPTPAAPAPNAASPPPRTPPPTTSAAAGAASWA